MTTNRRRPASPYHLVLAAALALAARPAAALDLGPDAAGLEVDLLPTISSAAAGEAGGALQPRAFEAEVSLKVGWGARVSP